MGGGVAVCRMVEEALADQLLDHRIDRAQGLAGVVPGVVAIHREAFVGPDVVGDDEGQHRRLGGVRGIGERGCRKISGSPACLVPVRRRRPIAAVDQRPRVRRIKYGGRFNALEFPLRMFSAFVR